MKKFIFCLSFLTFYVLVFAQETTSLERLATVQKIMGVEVYFMSEPLRNYEVVLSEGPGFSAASFFTAGLVNESIATKASKFVTKAIEEGKNQGKEFDAIIYNSGKSVVAIKFTDNATLANKSIGKVQLIDEIEIYILSEPLKDYDMINSKKGGLKAKSFLTAGLINNSIEEDIAQMTRRLNADAVFDNKTIQGVIYSAGKTAIGVKFK